MFDPLLSKLFEDCGLSAPSCADNRRDFSGKRRFFKYASFCCLEFGLSSGLGKLFFECVSCNGNLCIWRLRRTPVQSGELILSSRRQTECSTNFDCPGRDTVLALPNLASVLVSNLTSRGEADQSGGLTSRRCSVFDSWPQGWTEQRCEQCRPPSLKGIIARPMHAA